ncbi:Wzz/FepE/Etk N-terminal domain-containing protein [Catalinimonas sp. 4WD22]|uniref:Wzz/FepE/Etk N-terminal domain-containing protein n=1 Tax=Catalinimonas locisalis TaxID=3133978 RepID=UPI00310199A1
METQEKYYQEKDAKKEESTNGATAHHEYKVADDEIDLALLFKEIWRRKKLLLYTVLAALVIGIFVAIVSPEEYTTSIVLMPQSESNAGSPSGVLRQIGGFAGVNMGGSSAGLNKNLYPDITKSTPFNISVMEEEQYFPSLDTTMSLYHYFTEVSTPPLTDYLKNYTIGLPRMLLNLPMAIVSLFEKDEGSSTDNIQKKLNNPANSVDTLEAKDETKLEKEYNPIALSNKQIRVMSQLKNRISTTIETNGTVTVSAIMPDPLVAAKTTELAVAYLTRYITEYRTEKVQEDLDFIEKQYKEKEARYNKAQQKLAHLRDRNLNIATESARIALEQAQTDYNLSYSLYQGVSQQLEQARIKVQEETPVFKVLEPIQIPLKKSEPNRELIITLSLFAGIAVGLGIIVIQVIFSNIKSKF